MEPRPKLSVVAHLSNCLAHVAGSAPGWDGFAVRVDDRVIKTLRIDEEKLENLVVTVREAFDRVDHFMSLA